MLAHPEAAHTQSHTVRSTCTQTRSAYITKVQTHTHTQHNYTHCKKHLHANKIGIHNQSSDTHTQHNYTHCKKHLHANKISMPHQSSDTHTQQVHTHIYGGQTPTSMLPAWRSVLKSRMSRMPMRCTSEVENREVPISLVSHSCHTNSYTHEQAIDSEICADVCSK